MKTIYEKKVRVSIRTERFEMLSDAQLDALVDKIDDILDHAATTIACLADDPAHQVDILD